MPLGKSRLFGRITPDFTNSEAGLFRFQENDADSIGIIFWFRPAFVTEGREGSGYFS